MIQVSGRTYCTKHTPVIAICLDGTGPAYLEMAAPVMPNLQEMVRYGAFGLARSVIPSFTNPNNIAIVTGVPPAQNGICGNYYYDEAAGEEVMMNDPEQLRSPTILAGFSQAGHGVGIVTAKDKLRRLLGKGVRGVCFSVECARQTNVIENGIENVEEFVGRRAPGIYDPEISVFCIEAGVRLLADRELDLLYLTTTDFVQHKHAPGSPEAQTFYARIDYFLGLLHRMGAIIGVTADHGMNEKVTADGSPNVRYLETILTESGIGSRVILPITDPYVVHHAALGSYATVYFSNGGLEQGRSILQRVPGIELVLDRQQAQERFSLPGDRIGDLVVLSDQQTVLGKTQAWHDLEAVEGTLRSHGGLHESTVPFVLNRPLEPEYAARLASADVANYDLFDFLLNGTRSA